MDLYLKNWNLVESMAFPVLYMVWKMESCWTSVIILCGLGHHSEAFLFVVTVKWYKIQQQNSDFIFLYTIYLLKRQNHDQDFKDKGNLSSKHVIWGFMNAFTHMNEMHAHRGYIISVTEIWEYWIFINYYIFVNWFIFINRISGWLHKIKCIIVLQDILNERTRKIGCSNLPCT